MNTQLKIKNNLLLQVIINLKFRKNALFFYLSIILFIAPYQVKSQKADLKNLTNELQTNLDSIVKQYSLPGATFCVILPSGEKISIASGVADKETKVKMPSDAIIFTGSVGKTFVAAAILKLVELNKIKLDDLASTYFTNEPWFMKLPNAKDITVRMLLNHTSGIPEYVYDKEIYEKLKANPEKVWTSEERMYYSTIQKATNEPGKGWSYADANYILLGMIVEKVTGDTFYNIAEKWFIKPLKLKSTNPAISRKIKGLVAGYTGFSQLMLIPEKVAENEIYVFNPQFEWTGGGFTTCVSDLAIWAKELYGGKVLSEKMKKEMLTPVTVPVGLPENASYGLGAFVCNYENVIYYGHTGFVPGYITIMQYLPEKNISITLQTNTDKIRQTKSSFYNILKNIVIKFVDKK